MSSDLLVVATAAGADYREVAMREHTYSEAELRGFEQAQLRFEECEHPDPLANHWCGPHGSTRVHLTYRGH